MDPQKGKSFIHSVVRLTGNKLKVFFAIWVGAKDSGVNLNLWVLVAIFSSL